jgi:hypothetical protein
VGGHGGRMRLFVIPGGFLCGAALCAVLLHLQPHAFAIDRAQPLTVVTYWQQFGALMWLSLALAMAIASAGYIGAMRLPALRTARIAAICALACAAALAFPVIFSSDVYAYAAYGDLALHGISPYAHTPIAHPDALLRAAIWQWSNPLPVCVYGPAFVGVAGVASALLPLGAAAPLWALRIVSCAALVACAPLAWLAFAPLGARVRSAAAAGIALNPLAIWSAAEGHNDALALAVILAGFALIARSRAFTGALVVGLSALIKAPGVLVCAALPFFARTDRTRIAVGACAGIAIAVAGALPLIAGVTTKLAPAGHYHPQYSLQSLWWPIAAVVAVALAWTRKPIPMAFALMAAVPNPYPWYGLWIVPLAFLDWGTRSAWAAVLFSLLLTVRYLPDATSANVPAGWSAAVVAAEFALPLLLLFTGMWYERRRRPEIRTPDLGPAASRLQ